MITSGWFQAGIPQLRLGDVGGGLLECGLFFPLCLIPSSLCTAHVDIDIELPETALACDESQTYQDIKNMILIKIVLAPWIWQP